MRAMRASTRTNRKTIVERESAMKKEGWGFLFNSRKWHYFRGGMSLCGKWGLLSSDALEQGNDNSPENCAACKRKRLREVEKAAKEIHQ